jgi:hypothetical protein
MSFGAKVSQPGVDVRGASDFQLAMTSDWPLLKIHKQGAFSLDLTKAQTIVSHDLGYPCAFLIFKTTGNRSQITGPGNDEYGDSFYTDKNKLGFSIPASSPTGTYTGYYYIFRLDITKNFQAPTIALGSKPPGGGGGFGLETAKETKEASSTDFRDLSLSSETRSPMIHQVVAGDIGASGGVFDLVATHNLLYAPFFLAFFSSDNGGSYYSFYGGNANTVLIASDRSVTIRTATTGQKGSVVVFKDPFFFL